MGGRWVKITRRRTNLGLLHITLSYRLHRAFHTSLTAPVAVATSRTHYRAIGPLPPAASDGHCLSLASGGNWSDWAGPVVRVRLEAGLPTLVDRLLLRQLLNTWLWDGSPSGICPEEHSVWIATGTGGAWSPVLDFVLNPKTEPFWSRNNL